MTLGVALLIPVTLTFFGAGPVAGDDVAVASGARVRVLAPAISAKPFVGELVESDEETLTVRRTEGGPFSLGWPFRGSRSETLRLPRESVYSL